MSPLDYGVDELTSTGKMISWKDEGVDSYARGQGYGGIVISATAFRN